MKRNQKKNRRPKKHPYRTPVLRTHGDLKVLTTMKGGTKTDGASPKSRTGGGAV